MTATGSLPDPSVCWISSWSTANVDMFGSFVLAWRVFVASFVLDRFSMS